MNTKKMRACSPLLPPPGDRVVVECIDEIESLLALARDAYDAWDADDDPKVGKLLRAMLDEAFRSTYRPDLRPNGELEDKEDA